MFDEPKAMDYRTSSMSTGQIQLGVKKGSGEFLDRYSVQGFFYAGWTGLLEQPARGSVLASRVQEKEHSRKCQTPLAILSRKLVKPTQWPQEHTLCAPNSFYDNPSRKRDARCTNILPTGATLSGVGEGQRLRKGFQRQWRGSLTYGSNPFRFECGDGYPIQTEFSLAETLQTNCLRESPPSAAEIRHSARNTRLREKSFACA